MNGYQITSPKQAHHLAFAMGQDAANRQMREANRTKWNAKDAALACQTTQRWYANFNILNADQWMPKGYEWRQVAGQWKPMRKGS